MIKKYNIFKKKFKIGDLVKLKSEGYIPAYWAYYKNRDNIDLSVLEVVSVDSTDKLAYEIKPIKQNTLAEYWFEEYMLEKLSDYEIAAIKYNL